MKVLHRADGQYTEDEAIWYVIVFGVVGTLTMAIVGAIIPGKVGPWWMWTAALVGFVFWGWRALGKGSIVIELLDDNGTLRVSVKGSSVQVDEALAPGFEHWCKLERIPVRMGGGQMAHFNLMVTTTNGRRLGFRQMGGSDTAGWPTRPEKLSDGPDVFMTLDIFGLQGALAERRPGASEETQ